MKIEYVKLTGYIGIYNGLNLKEIEINFNKSKHKTIVIKGKNGSGKSSLFNALHPLPDTNEKFIPNEYAEKHMILSHEDSTYEIKIIHNVKENGNRETTKAYMKKQDIVGLEELNPNGNVSSYKEILYDELSLDPNFISLSQLSGDNRGLADKTPTDRKKFVNSIISNLDVYNDIHKTLTKRSTIFKSMMNSLSSKIDNIGDEEKLKLTIKSMEDQIQSLLSNKEKQSEHIGMLKARIQANDPNGEIQQSYKTVSDNHEINKNKINTITDKIKSLRHSLRVDDNVIIEEILDKYKKLKEKITHIESDIFNKENEIQSILLRREEESSILQSKTSKLERLTCVDINEINSSIENTVRDIGIYKNEMLKAGIGIDHLNSITKDEYLSAVNTLEITADTIIAVRSDFDNGMLIDAVNRCKNNNLISQSEILEYESNIFNIEKEVELRESIINEYENLKTSSAVLDNRPNGCVIDDCMFIKVALENRNKMNTIDIDSETKAVVLLKNELLVLEDRLKYSKELMLGCNKLQSIKRNIDANLNILNKLNINLNVGIYDMILEMEFHSEKLLCEVNTKINNSNIIELYSSSKSTLQELKNMKNKYEDSMGLYNELEQDINTLNTKINSITNTLESTKNVINENKDTLIKMKTLSSELDVLINMTNERAKYIVERNDIMIRMHNLEQAMTTIQNDIVELDRINIIMDDINKKINPIMSDRDKKIYSLNLLEEYKVEYNEYSSKFDKIETIKKYSSPSKGIQTLFMSLYMNKTISMANELLSSLFGGEYILGNFEINESEFRIPCIGNGLPNYDISCMSTSQICMISMIISFVLLYQSSSKYNIIKMDEIDGGLDTENRLQFLSVLDNLQSMLNVEQCIMISHNTEMDLSNCDIIQLKSINNETPVGNILYSY